MRKVIDGRTYDTEAAEVIAEWTNGVPASDMRFQDEKVYRTANGRYFLYGEGGAMSRWAEPTGDRNTYGPGRGIRPMDREETRQVLEMHDCFEALDTYFADMLTDA